MCSQQGEIEEACSRAIEALSITTQLKSPTVLQRLLSLQEDLEPWKGTSNVKDITERISSLIIVRQDLE